MIGILTAVMACNFLTTTLQLSYITTDAITAILKYILFAIFKQPALTRLINLYTYCLSYQIQIIYVIVGHLDW